jgi:hypothetical protein
LLEVQNSLARKNTAVREVVDMLAETRLLDVHSNTGPLPRTWLDRLLWPLLLLLAWLAFELTANATLSLVLACVRFGMNDFRTAWWLWQTDPQRRRAHACASFYAASGVWKTALVPLLTAGVIAIVWGMIAPQAMQRQHPVTQQLMLAIAVGMWAASILIVLAGSAAVLSLRARWRVWVHPGLHGCRKAEIWPPHFSPANTSQANQAILIMLTALFAAILIGPVATLLTLKLFEPPAALRRIVELLVVFGYPIFGVMAFGVMRGKLFAESPWECWPESIRQLAAGDQSSGS